MSRNGWKSSNGLYFSPDRRFAARRDGDKRWSLWRRVTTPPLKQRNPLAGFACIAQRERTLTACVTLANG